MWVIIGVINGDTQSSDNGSYVLDPCEYRVSAPANWPIFAGESAVRSDGRPEGEESGKHFRRGSFFQSSNVK